MAVGSAYLFLLGLASGIAFLALTSYRHVSPRWLKWVLIASGALLMSRYVMTAVWPNVGGVVAIFLELWWVIGSVGLTLPGVFAIDQLIRHPAMTPSKLLRWYALFLLVNGVALIGMALVPKKFWFVFVQLTYIIFLIGLVGVCLLLRRKIPSRLIQRASLGLALSYGYLGLSILIVTLGLGQGDERVFLYPEMLVLFALWYAYETSARLQQSV